MFNTIFNDAPHVWQLGFQDSAAPAFTGIVTLHNTIGFYLIVLCFIVFWALTSIIYYYGFNRNPIAYKYLTHGTILVPTFLTYIIYNYIKFLFLIYYIYFIIYISWVKFSKFLYNIFEFTIIFIIFIIYY